MLASDLAEQIKELKAAHTVEAVPQRSGIDHRSTEEPVTARIRRRMEADWASDHVIEPDSAAGVATNHSLPDPQAWPAFLTTPGPAAPAGPSLIREHCQG
jgi:hypothetical protein